MSDKFKIFEVLKNNRQSIDSFRDLALNIKGELSLDTCLIPGNILSKPIISAEKPVSPLSTVVNENTDCEFALNVHFHPGIEGDRFTGLGNLSPTDEVYYQSRLEKDPSFVAGCVVGEKDRVIECIEKSNKENLVKNRYILEADDIKVETKRKS